MAKKPRRNDYVPAEDPPSPEVKEALDTVAELERLIDEEIDERALARGQDFFDSILERSKSIGATIERTGRVSEPQRLALENMLDGVRKWIHED